MTGTAEIARRLVQAREDITAVASFADEYPDLDLAAAYEVQRLQRAGSGPLVGWKLGGTSLAKQAQTGLHEPIRGFLSTDHVLDIGEPLDTAQHIHPRAEPEIVFVMGQDLQGSHVSAAEVLAATASVSVGIEVLDSRYVDYQFTMPDVVADNVSAGRFVVGTPVPAAGIDLRLVGVVLEKNGEVFATASGAASLGHPAAAVAWLVRSLAQDGEGLRQGDVIISGGLTAAVPVAAGDVIVASIDRLGTLVLACR
jgi:2-oxo-3-hexenedioate decarboxylase